MKLKESIKNYRNISNNQKMVKCLNLNKNNNKIVLKLSGINYKNSKKKKLKFLDGLNSIQNNQNMTKMI